MFAMVSACTTMSHTTKRQAVIGKMNNGIINGSSAE